MDIQKVSNQTVYEHTPVPSWQEEICVERSTVKPCPVDAMPK